MHPDVYKMMTVKEKENCNVDGIEPVGVPTIIEVCCGEDSLIGRDDIRGNTKVIRITEAFDFRTKSGLRYCLDQIREAKNPLLHGTLPCTAGCPWRRIIPWERRSEKYKNDTEN